MRVFYSDKFNHTNVSHADANHDGKSRSRSGPPAGKHARVRAALLREGVLAPDDIIAPPPVSDADLLRVHAPDYVAAIDEGTIAPAAMRRIGFPWSPAVPTRARLAMGGAVAAARAAFEDGFAGLLAGGAHHAHYDFGAGYCVFNDFAIAAAAVLADGLAARVAVIDLDVHQGDGNAALLRPRDDVFVFSLHAEKNYPFRKIASDLDVGLADGAEDEAYLRALEAHLPAVFDFRPDLVLYQAGVDPLVEDRLGRLALTQAGLARRDEMVFEACFRRGVPVATALGGGYAAPFELSVAAYVNTYRAARDVFG